MPGKFIVHICYIDDSGDTTTRVFSVLSIPVSEWNQVLVQIRDFRRMLKLRDGIYVTREFHATDFVAGRGNISESTIPKGARCRIFKETLNEVTKLPGARLFNASSPKSSEEKVFERLLNRINRTMEAWDSHAILISDEGKDYTYLVRRMRVHNLIPSMYGQWPRSSSAKNIPLERIIEDIVFRKSERSYFIQLADFCAYALFRSERPLPSKTKYGLDQAFNILTGICVTECFRKDPRKLGIVRET